LRVRFVQMAGEVFHVRVKEVDGSDRVHECWPTVVMHALDGAQVPLRFAWDRYHRVLYVDERWPALGRLPRGACEETAARLARRVMREAAERASG
jgi:hypothetical protein